MREIKIVWKRHWSRRGSEEGGGEVVGLLPPLQLVFFYRKVPQSRWYYMVQGSHCWGLREKKKSWDLSYPPQSSWNDNYLKLLVTCSSKEKRQLWTVTQASSKGGRLKRNVPLISPTDVALAPNLSDSDSDAVTTARWSWEERKTFSTLKTQNTGPL